MEFQRVQAEEKKKPIEPAASFEALTIRQAIEIVNSDYADVLDNDQLVKAFDVLINFSHANAFCVMGKSSVRDAWLLRHINKIE